MTQNRLKNIKLNPFEHGWLYRSYCPHCRKVLAEGFYSIKVEISNLIETTFLLAKEELIICPDCTLRLVVPAHFITKEGVLDHYERVCTLMYTDPKYFASMNVVPSELDEGIILDSRVILN